MPVRQIPLVNDIYYHIYNRGVNKQPIFLQQHDYKRALNLLHYYKQSDIKLKYSKFLMLPNELRKGIWLNFEKSDSIIDIVSYCLMPNHFHLLLKQNRENGVAEFLANFQNSYAKYFNKRCERVGPLFQGRFKAVVVESDDQLFHLTRYIHLNPSTSNVIKTNELEDYKWSSFREYIGKSEFSFCTKDIILNNFKDKESYRKFVLNYAENQRELNKIKHLIIEKS